MIRIFTCHKKKTKQARPIFEKIQKKLTFPGFHKPAICLFPGKGYSVPANIHNIGSCVLVIPGTVVTFSQNTESEIQESLAGHTIMYVFVMYGALPSPPRSSLELLFYSASTENERRCSTVVYGVVCYRTCTLKKMFGIYSYYIVRTGIQYS